MKNLFFAIALILSINVCAQNGFENTNVFVRVYNLQGKKLAKEKIFSISETSLQLKGKREPVIIAASSIGLIKTKHSGGNNVLMGAATGATGLAILMAASAGPDDLFDPGGAAAAGAFLGGIAGAAIGGLTSLFKNSKSYIISGDELKWKEFKETITGLK